MKRNKPTKRLSLNRTTVRALQEQDLDKVAGGCSYAFKYTYNNERCSESCTNVCTVEQVTWEFC